MMLTQRFTPDDPRREGAFLWNYAGMNIGFFVGFTVAGYFQATESYSNLFIFATLGNFAAIVLAAFNWKTLMDRNTPLLEATPKQFRLRRSLASRSSSASSRSSGSCYSTRNDGAAGEGDLRGVAATLVYLTLSHPTARTAEHVGLPDFHARLARVLVALSDGAQWPAAFAVNNVDLMVGSVRLQPQWIQNINTVVIVIGGPILAALFTRLRARGWSIDIPQQFAVSLLLMALAFLPPVGIALAGSTARAPSSGSSRATCFQSIGELLISPVGYAMIGKLAPSQYQGVMMGSWMLVTGLASLFAGDFSGMIPEPTAPPPPRPTPLMTSSSDARCGSLVVGVTLVVFIPFLRKLITDKAETLPAEIPATTVVPV